MHNLRDKLKIAKAGWSYLWNLLEKEVQKENLPTEILMQFYKYQVDLESAKYILELFEEKLKNISLLNDDDKEALSDAISRHISNFQAIAFSIENLLRE